MKHNTSLNKLNLRIVAVTSVFVIIVLMLIVILLPINVIAIKYASSVKNEYIGISKPDDVAQTTPEPKLPDESAESEPEKKKTPNPSNPSNPVSPDDPLNSEKPLSPPDSKKPDTPSGPFDPAEAPKTADETNPKLLFTGLLAAAVFLKQILITKRKGG